MYLNIIYVLLKRHDIAEYFRNGQSIPAWHDRHVTKLTYSSDLSKCPSTMDRTSLPTGPRGADWWPSPARYERDDHWMWQIVLSAATICLAASLMYLFLSSNISNLWIPISIHCEINMLWFLIFRKITMKIPIKIHKEWTKKINTYLWTLWNRRRRFQHYQWNSETPGKLAPFHFKDLPEHRGIRSVVSKMAAVVGTDYFQQTCNQSSI